MTNIKKKIEAESTSGQVSRATMHHGSVRSEERPSEATDSSDEGALDKRRWSQPNTMRASGSCYKKSMRMGRRIDT